MPKTTKKKTIRCEFFSWLVGKRGAVYMADGRSNNPPTGRHSLGTRDYDEALTNLQQLDRTIAVKLGLADPSVIRSEAVELLSLAEGRRRYDEHVQRPRVAGGPAATSAKRYRAVLDKFEKYANGLGIKYWNEVDRSTLEGYAAYLDGKGYAYATEYLELNTIKQVVKFLVDRGLLPASNRIEMPLRKPEGTDTYCWCPEEVRAIVEFCSEVPTLRWLGNVVVGLACTGLRISELAALRWTDIDPANNTIFLSDETTKAAKRLRRERRSTKGRRSRSFPIHKSLQSVLERIPRAADGRIFHGPRGGVLKPDTVRNILRREVLTPLGSKFPTPPDEIGFTDGRLHSFRHYFCSRCANEGVPEQVVMNWLGHRSSRMVRHYYHLSDEESQRQMSRLDFV